MDTTVAVGIDVSKDRLDVHVCPAGAVLSFGRDAGIDALMEALAGPDPQVIAVEAIGGFETVVVASLAAAGLPVVVNPLGCGPSRSRSAGAPRPIRLTLG